MALDYNDRFKNRVSTTFEYPFGKAKNATTPTSDDGTPFEQDIINDQWGFFQKLLVDAGQTPNGVVDTAVSSQYMDALRTIFTQPVTDKIFISFSGDGLAKVSYFPSTGAGTVFSVYSADSDQQVIVYANKEGSVELPQNGINNVANPSGEISFFISEGDYYLKVNSLDVNFSVIKNTAALPLKIESIGEDVDTIRDNLNTSLDDILDIRDTVDGVLKPQLNIEKLSRQETDKELFNTTASLAQFRRNSTDEFNTLRDATFEVNPDDGTIGLRAYNYTDDAFTQAGILIDGVNAEVNIQAGRITDLGDAVEDANSEINVLAGQIELKASYTEMTEYVNGALDAIIPAYSFGFFNSSEGWSAVNGVITQGSSLITTTWGDIENQSLNYSADNNPVITLTYKRLSGTGYTGDLIVTFQNGSTQTYTGVIGDSSVDSSTVQNLNLSEEPTYTGTVTGIRLVLGTGVEDEWEISGITIGKPSSELEALDGITAQVNQLGIDIDAIEGQLTSFVTTTYYDENTVTLNNVTQVLDGEEAIISLRATQQELDDEGTVTKANSASVWVDGADANIRTSVVSFNAEDGGIDDQIAGLQGDLNTVSQELSTIDGAKIRSNLVSINRIETKTKDLDELQFYTELKLLDQKNRDLELGDSVAIVDTQVKALSTDQGALAQELLELTASTGVIEGQVTASVSRINQAETDISGNAQAISALTTEVENTQGDMSDAQLILDSTIDDLGVVSSRAYLGVSTTVDGKTTVTGITADSSTNGLRFQGDVIQFDDTAGNPALQYRSDLDKWTFNGQLVVGGYTVNSEEDIRALDGDTIYEKYQYSVNGTSGWHDNFTDGDLFRRTATVTNGVVGSYSSGTRITGYTPAIISNPDGSYTISNGTETATIYDGTDGASAPIPTITDNGDGTVTIDNGAGESATISDGVDGETPVKGVDYFDGLDGSFVSNIYITSSTGTPSTPSGGSFNGTVETYPTNWQDTPYYVSGEVTYISTARYREISSGVWQHGGWSTPSEYIIKGDKGDNPFGIEVTSGTFNISGNSYLKTNSVGWNAGISSISSYRSCKAETFFQSTSRAMIGLSYTPSNGDYSQMDYALYNYEGSLIIYEKGDLIRSNLGSYSGAELLSVTSDGYTVKYYSGQTLLYTSTSIPNGDLYLDIAVDTNTSTLAPAFTVLGADGEAGQVGAGFYGLTVPTIRWDGEWPDFRFEGTVGRPAVKGDILTQTRDDGTDSQARQYDGSNWVSVALQVNGSIVASNTIAGDKLIAGTEISAPKVVGGEVIGAKVATSSGTGLRVELEDDGTYMQWIGTGAKTDLNALFYVKSNGEGFIKGDFFQGEIVSSESASNLTTGTSTSTVIHSSNGKSIKIDGSGNVNFNAVGDYQDQLVGSIEITIKRGGTTLNSVSAPLYGLLYDSFNNRTSVSGSVSLSALDTQSVGDFTFSASVSTNFTGQTTGSIQTYSQVSTFENLIA